MRYIALSDDTEPLPATATVDWRSMPTTCFLALVALNRLAAAAAERQRVAVDRGMFLASNYHAGRNEAFSQAARMLQGILTGTFTKKLTVDEIIGETTEK